MTKAEPEVLVHLVLFLKWTADKGTAKSPPPPAQNFTRL